MNQETEAKTPSVPRLSKQRSRAPNTSSTRPAQVATFRYLQRGKHPSIRTCESSPNDEWKHRRSITGSRRLLIYTAVPTAGDAGPRLPVPMPMPMPSQNVKQGVRTAAASDIRRLPPVPQCQTRPLACCGIDVDTGTARHYLQRILSENTVREYCQRILSALFTGDVLAPARTNTVLRVFPRDLPTLSAGCNSGWS